MSYEIIDRAKENNLFSHSKQSQEHTSDFSSFNVNMSQFSNGCDYFDGRTQHRKMAESGPDSMTPRTKTGSSFASNKNSKKNSEEFSFIKLRHGLGGNHVKDILSQQQVNSPHFRNNHFMESSSNFVPDLEASASRGYFNDPTLSHIANHVDNSETVNSTQEHINPANNPFQEKRYLDFNSNFCLFDMIISIRRNTSPQKFAPSYLLPTSSFQKKSTSPTAQHSKKAANSSSYRNKSANNFLNHDQIDDSHFVAWDKPMKGDQPVMNQLDTQVDINGKVSRLSRQNQDQRSDRKRSDSASTYSQMNVVDYYNRMQSSIPAQAKLPDQGFPPDEYRRESTDPYDFHRFTHLNADDRRDISVNTPNYQENNPQQHNYYSHPRNQDQHGHEERKSHFSKSNSKKVDKAQKLLLYGTLHDVMDARRDWERNLRK